MVVGRHHLHITANTRWLTSDIFTRKKRSVFAYPLVGIAALELAAQPQGIDFDPHPSAEQLKAPVHVQSLKKLLLEGRTLAEAEGGDVDEGLRIVDRLE